MAIDDEDENARAQAAEILADERRQRKREWHAATTHAGRGGRVRLP
jgi:hypothetical protein